MISLEEWVDVRCLDRQGLDIRECTIRTPLQPAHPVRQSVKRALRRHRNTWVEPHEVHPSQLATRLDSRKPDPVLDPLHLQHKLRDQLHLPKSALLVGHDGLVHVL